MRNIVKNSKFMFQFLFEAKKNFNFFSLNQKFFSLKLIIFFMNYNQLIDFSLSILEFFQFYFIQIQKVLCYEI